MRLKRSAREALDQVYSGGGDQSPISDGADRYREAQDLARALDCASGVGIRNRGPRPRSLRNSPAQFSPLPDIVQGVVIRAAISKELEESGHADCEWVNDSLR